MSEHLISVHQPVPRITVITLNRPEKRNALNIALIEQLHDAIAAAEHQNGRAIVLRANGPSFCAGLDLTEAEAPEFRDRSAAALAALYETLASSPLITIAAPHGAAMGGGAGLVAACDFALGADDLRLAYPEVHRGLVAALVTCLLRRQLSDGAARNLILLGQTLDATAARSMGLITRVIPRGDLDRASLQFAEEAIQGAPGAIARTKRLLDQLAARPLKEDLNIALAHHMAARESAEAAEGLAAFREKRPPRW